jgi:hypothetical protein
LLQASFGEFNLTFASRYRRAIKEEMSETKETPGVSGFPGEGNGT